MTLADEARKLLVQLGNYNARGLHTQSIAIIGALLTERETMKEALELAEDRLGFHEGSEAIVPNVLCLGAREGAKPVIWINAQGGDGDFQMMLEAIRAALKEG
tara:strand:- start:573 stop:881 length:309 start_codon:yes stop_codon:yes gene_type:complete